MRSIPLTPRSAHDVCVAVASERIRILVTDLPRMLREIIDSAVADQRDMELVTRFESQPVVADALASDAHVVILGVDHLQAVLVLLEARPKMTVSGSLPTGKRRAS